MSDTDHILRRQAEWQKRRAHLPWPEKIRLAESMLPTLRHWNSRSARCQRTIKHTPSKVPLK